MPQFERNKSIRFIIRQDDLHFFAQSNNASNQKENILVSIDEEVTFQRQLKRCHLKMYNLFLAFRMDNCLFVTEARTRPILAEKSSPKLGESHGLVVMGGDFCSKSSNPGIVYWMDIF